MPISIMRSINFFHSLRLFSACTLSISMTRSSGSSSQLACRVLSSTTLPGSGRPWPDSFLDLPNLARRQLQSLTPLHGICHSIPTSRCFVPVLIRAPCGREEQKKEDVRAVVSVLPNS
ncbi:hypothetical protein C8J56DRAFT_535865 [Mycena floridula]|nr:hypothetical protein C8J56DRAFT_535865 [Mycena floridula]